MADGDLFKSADRQRAGVRDAVPAVKKVGGLGWCGFSAMRGLQATGILLACRHGFQTSKLPRGSNGPTRLPAEQLPPSPTAHDMQTVIKTLPVEAGRAKLSESAAADKEASGSKPGSSASAAADVSKVSASPFASLGGLGGGVTMLGGSGGSGPLGSISLSTVGPSSSSARERALAAARRVPSPEPQPKKEKAKKVTWRKEDALVGVRWFLKVSSEHLLAGMLV